MKKTIDSLDQHEEYSHIGEAYGGSSELTSIRSDGFALSNEEKSNK